MNKTFTLSLGLILSLSLSAKTINVSEGQSIQSALNGAQSGDVVKVADGIYYESLTVPKGVTLEGTSINTVLSGLQSPGQRGIYNNGTVRWMTVEFFDTQSDGAIFNNDGLVEYCVVRGCRMKEASIWNEDNGIVRGCLMHNNEPSRDSWPNSGGFYNADGKVYNCTSARNFGGYSGWHAESYVVNSASWGNTQEVGFEDKATYTSSEATGSAKNASDSGFGGFFTVPLKKDNMDAKGPHFVDPTPFAGAPTNELEREAVRLADFRIMKGSALINKGKTVDGQPNVDLVGVKRPQADTIDVGAFEYDPNMKAVKPTGIRLLQDTLRLYLGDQGYLFKEITPHNATNKTCQWISSNTCATVENGVVTATKIGKAVITVQTAIGRYTASAVVIVSEQPEPYVCPEVRLADSLYHIEDYTIPSYIPMWIAKEKCRKDSSQVNLDTLQLRISELIGKEEPYCVVANINGDAKTRMAFAWFTNNGIEQGQVQLVAKANATESDFAGDVLSFDATPLTAKDLRYAVSNSGIIKATGMPSNQCYTYISHKVVAEGLTPGTQYCYRVGYAGHWSDIRTFRTQDAEQGDFSFLYMTDSHLMNKLYVEQAQMCSYTAAKNEPNARFLLFPGDFVETGDKGNSEWEWERWFEQSMRPTLSIMPVAPTDGNHDDSPNLNYTYHFNTDNQFNKQTKIKPQFQGITYSFVYGDVLFMVYSKQDYWRGAHDKAKETSEYLTRDLGNWFRQQVSEHPNTKWRVALVHFNIFSGSGHQEDEITPTFRTCMLPIIKELEIDVIMQGHDHCYEVMGPVNPDTRTPILSAIKDREEVPVDKVKNMSGYKGGTFDVSDGPLFFIGATCGEKRYEPYSREEMDENISKHKVQNYFDLFTGMFGQPGKPSYTRVDVTPDTLTFNSFTTSRDSVATQYNQFRVIRSKEHSEYHWTDLDDVIAPMPKASEEARVFMWNGNVYVSKNNAYYSILGQPINVSKLAQR